MSTTSYDDASASPKPKAQRPKWKPGEEGPPHEMIHPLPIGWVIFYLGCAVTISWLYYRNPGFWELVRHTRDWLKYTRQLL